MLERRRPVLQSWAYYICGADASNVILRIAEQASA
jgi:hypothetical protein